VILAALTLYAGACGSDGDDDPAPKQAASQNALRCKPGEPRSCPCLGGGMGMQSCDASGASFSACTGCQAVMAMAGGRAAGAGTSPLGGQGGAALSGTGGVGGGGGNGVAGAPSAGQGGAGGSGGAAGSQPGKPSQLPAAKGVSCGVGLPVQCQPDTEKCCKRSLALDSCEAVATACECDDEDCSTVDVRCDGPEDCPTGQLCCASDGSSGGGGSSRPRFPGSVRYTAFACAASCSSPTRQACHSMTDCPSQLTCAIDQVLASISICTNPDSLEQ
jgi:hypothetical protein